MTRPSMSVGWLAWLTLAQSVVVTWVLSRQPVPTVSGGAENLRGHAHMMPSGPSPPPAISAERWPHLVGIAFLTAHIVFVLLAMSLYGLRNALRRMGKPGSSFPARLIAAGIACLAAAAATPVVAWIGLGEQPVSQTLYAVTEVSRYTFAAAVVFIALFGMPWRNPAHTDEETDNVQSARVRETGGFRRGRAGPDGQLRRGRPAGHGTPVAAVFRAAARSAGGPPRP